MTEETLKEEKIHLTEELRNTREYLDEIISRLTKCDFEKGMLEIELEQKHPTRGAEATALRDAWNEILARNPGAPIEYKILRDTLYEIDNKVVWKYRRRVLDLEETVYQLELRIKELKYKIERSKETSNYKEGFEAGKRSTEGKIRLLKQEAKARDELITILEVDRRNNSEQRIKEELEISPIRDDQEDLMICPGPIGDLCKGAHNFCAYETGTTCIPYYKRLDNKVSRKK
jgi:hypothetical protein